MKRGLILLLGLLLISFASASMTISDVNDVYNIGDKIYITTIVNPSVVFGNFEINLVCDGSSLNLYKVPAEPSFSIGSDQKITTYITLLSENIGNLTGECYVSSSISDEKAQTKTFTITNKILINASLDKTNYNPGETIKLKLNAVKLNGQNLEGFLEASGAQDFSKAITKGIVEWSFAMPENSEAKDYTLSFSVYDKGKDNAILNSGSSSISFKINQIAKTLQTSIDSVDIIPGNNLTLSVDLLDQSGNKMNGSIAVKLVSPDKSEANLKLNSGEFVKYYLPYNISDGKWNIYSSYGTIGDSKDFIVEKIQKVSFDFLDSILVVRNIGNSVYNQTAEVKIGSQTISLPINNLGIGEEKKFNINAPNGEYDVSVSDSDSSATKRVLLTGNAISVKDAGRIGIFNQYPIVWVFVIAIIALLAVIALLKYFKKKTYDVGGSVLNSKKLYPVSKKYSEMREENKNDFISYGTKVSSAESSGILKGHKSNASVIAIKLNNVPGNAKDEIEKAFAKAKVKKGIIELKDNYALIIFSHLITKTEDNEFTAAKVAYEISKDFQEYNKRYNDKIEFGMGVSSGELIAAVENGKFKYTSVRGTVVLAKKIADASNNSVMISAEARKKVLKDVKVDKSIDVAGKQAFEIRGITDRDSNQGKLDDLLKRMQHKG